MSDCPICGGRKHVYKDGVLERCDCLINQLVRNRLIEAGVSRPFEEITYKSLESLYPRVLPKAIEISQACSEALKKHQMPEFKGGIKRPLFCFSGPDDGVRDVLSANILKDSVLGDFSILNTTVSELIVRCFDKNETLNLNKEFFEYDVICVYFGNENQPNLANKVLRDLIRLRANSNAFLFFTTHLTEESLKLRLENDLASMISAGKIKYLRVEA